MAGHGIRIADLFDGTSDPIVTEPREGVANRNALRLWREASTIAGSPAEKYLVSRGITISSTELRFHPRMHLGPKGRSEEHTSDLQTLMRNSYAAFCLEKIRCHNCTK